MSKNYFPSVIDIITSDKTDIRSLLIQIAKTHPKAVCDAHTFIAGPAPITWQQECAAMKKAGNFIAAIKRCREITGWGLKESKDAVDGLEV